MEKFKFIHIGELYRTCDDVVRQLLKLEGLFLCNLRHVDSLPADIVARLKTHDRKSQIVILNKYLPHGYATGMQSSLFPFSSMHKHGRGSTLLSKEEALRQGNYFLCVEDTADASSTTEPEERVPSWMTTNSDGVDYRYHVDIESTRMYRNDPPYVNMDRASDNIGGSSWDGNLVSWFRGQFRTRLLYGVYSGLFPEE